MVKKDNFCLFIGSNGRALNGFNSNERIDITDKY